MRARDRLVLMAIAIVVVLGAGWLLAVKPARQQAATLETEVTAARSQLTTTQGEIVSAQGARQRYRAAYASLATLGIAVPTSSEVPALMYTIDQASNRKKVEFASISGGGSGGSGSSGAGSAAGAAQAAAFTQMPFTFTFEGTYKDLIKLLGQLEGFTVQGPSGTLRVSGRLLTIQSISFSAPAASGSSGSSSQSGSSSGARPGEMSWSITATAYVLPAAPTAPAPAAGTSGGAQPASGGGGAAASPAGAPAVVRATP
jgi:Type II secretion system (T2SS), protein M